MRRALIVTSCYAPTMAADMQRARHLDWELPALGWNVEILAPSTDYQPATCLDPDSDQFFPPNSCAHSVQEFLPRIFKIAGIGTVGWRALLSMWRAGNRLLSTQRFDVVYISTSHFPLFLLGPIWRRQFSVPYILDFQDPLYKPESAHPAWAKPGLKHRINRYLAKHVESFVTTGARGLIAVSPKYIDTLRDRYQRHQPAWMRPGRNDAIPFAARGKDITDVTASRSFRKVEARCRIAYVGVGGPVMQKSFNLLCRVLSQMKQLRPDLCDGLQIELYGTTLGWMVGSPRYLFGIAEKWGVGDLVIEEPGRVSYRQSIEILMQCDGALILGVDDIGYMPSKLFSYALSGKPLLAILARNGAALSILTSISNLGHALWIGRDSDMPTEEAIPAFEAFLDEVISRRTFDRRNAIAPYLAPAMALRHIQVFEACLSPVGESRELEHAHIQEAGS